MFSCFLRNRQPQFPIQNKINNHAKFSLQSPIVRLKLPKIYHSKTSMKTGHKGRKSSESLLQIKDLKYSEKVNLILLIKYSDLSLKSEIKLLPHAYLGQWILCCPCLFLSGRSFYSLGNSFGVWIFSKLFFSFKSLFLSNDAIFYH